MNRARRPRVGFLTYGLDRPLTGVTRVALELGRALQASGACDVVFLTPYRRGPLRSGRARSWYLPGCSRLPALMTLGGPSVALAARRLRLDLVHDPVEVSPFTLGRWAGRFKRVFSIYDAIAHRQPESYPWFNTLLYRRYIPRTLANVDGVVTASAHAAHDLRRFLHVPSDRLHVVPLGVADQFCPLSHTQRAATAEQHGLREPYILSVGAPQPRKNLGRLVEAFARLHARHPAWRLVIAGPSPWRHDAVRERIDALSVRDAVTALGYVPDEELPAIYSAAGLFVFPSLLEGFGLPVLEAMACGVPVVASNAASLPEVAGDAALLVEPTDTDALSAAMERVIADPVLAASLRQRGRERAVTFSWARAEKTVAVYREVLNR